MILHVLVMDLNGKPKMKNGMLITKAIEIPDGAKLIAGEGQEILLDEFGNPIYE